MNENDPEYLKLVLIHRSYFISEGRNAVSIMGSGAELLYADFLGKITLSESEKEKIYQGITFQYKQYFELVKLVMKEDKDYKDSKQ